MNPEKSEQARLIIDGKDALDAILEGIARAKHTIRIRSFMWRDDVIGRCIVESLLEKLNTSEIRIFIDKDAFGGRVYNLQKIVTFGRMGGDIFSSDLGRKLISQKRVTYKTLGWGSFLLCKYLKESDHSKVWLFDDEYPEVKAIIGGMNIAEEYLTNQNLDDPDHGGWHDYMIELSGDLAKRIAHHSAPKGEEKRVFRDRIQDGIEFIMNIRGMRLMRGEILSELSRARKSVIIEHAYITDRAIIRRLRQLAQRGISVNIVIPDRSDGVYHANMATLEKLLKPRRFSRKKADTLRVYLYPGHIHAKAIIVDRKTAILGSANLTYGSFDLLMETNAIFREGMITRDLLMQIEKDISIAKRIQYEDIPPYKKWLAWIQRIFI